MAETKRKMFNQRKRKNESWDILKQKNENRKDIFTQKDANTDSKKERKRGSF